MDISIGTRELERFKNRHPLSDLCDGKVQADINDDSEEEDIEGPYNQERLLQHQDLIKVVMNLVKKTKNINPKFLQFTMNKKAKYNFSFRYHLD